MDLGVLCFRYRVDVDNQTVWIRVFIDQIKLLYKEWSGMDLGVIGFRYRTDVDSLSILSQYLKD